jgi:pyroglutamyl-peptidase
MKRPPMKRLPTKPGALPTVLITGFEPFGGESVNPSWAAVRALQGARIAGHRVETRCLPVVFGGALTCLRKAIAETKPALVICIGQAGGRAQISLERIAINVDDARKPDNAGNSPVDAPIITGGPAGYFSTLPIKRLLAELQRAEIPAEISQSAGTYVCNHVFYGLMHSLRKRRGLRGGFVHIPYSPEQAARHRGAASLPTETVTAAIRIIVRTTLKQPLDLPIPADATH